MLKDKRFVFDTNVLISALLLRNSTARQAFDKASSGGKMLISQATLSELNNVLQRKDFAKYITDQDRVEFLAALVREGIMVEIVERISVCRDPKDDKFLELAINGQATCIVSGDDDLIILKSFRGIPILTPRQFVES